MQQFTQLSTEADQFSWTANALSPDYLTFLNDLLDDDFSNPQGEIQWSKKQNTHSIS